MTNIMMQSSVGPGIAPRSRNFQSARISSIHGVPINSSAKYSIRCDAAPRNTEKQLEKNDNHSKVIEPGHDHKMWYKLKNVA